MFALSERILGGLVPFNLLEQTESSHTLLLTSALQGRASRSVPFYGKNQMKTLTIPRASGRELDIDIHPRGLDIRQSSNGWSSDKHKTLSLNKFEYDQFVAFILANHTDQQHKDRKP